MPIVREERLTIEGLRRKGFPVIPGDRYIPASQIPKKVLSLAAVRHRLSKIKGSFAETVSVLRDEE